METQSLTRENILRDIRFQCHFNRLMLLLFFLLLLQFFFMMKHVGSMFLAQVSVFSMFVIYVLLLFKIWHRRFGNYKLKLSGSLVFSQILWVATEENFQNVRFDAQGPIPEAVIRAPGFSFAEKSHIYRPDHYAAAMWEGIPLEIQHMCMGYTGTGYNLSPDGSEASTYKTLEVQFRGMIYLCHLGRPFTPTTLHTGKPLAGEIRTGDAAFDRRFSVKTQDPRTMPLSDGMRRFLTKCVGKYRGRVYIHFAGNGDVYVAFHQKLYDGNSGRDTEAFARLDDQANLVKGLLNGLNRGF